MGASSHNDVQITPQELVDRQRRVVYGCQHVMLSITSHFTGRLVPANAENAPKEQALRSAAADWVKVMAVAVDKLATLEGRT